MIKETIIIYVIDVGITITNHPQYGFTIGCTCTGDGEPWVVDGVVCYCDTSITCFFFLIPSQ